MNCSQDKSTNAIKEYFCLPGPDGVNIINIEQDLATRRVNHLVVGDEYVNRSKLNPVLLEIIDRVEDLAASYITLKKIRPVDAVELAYQEIETTYMAQLSINEKYIIYQTYTSNISNRKH